MRRISRFEDVSVFVGFESIMMDGVAFEGYLFFSLSFSGYTRCCCWFSIKFWNFYMFSLRRWVFIWFRYYHRHRRMHIHIIYIIVLYQFPPYLPYFLSLNNPEFQLLICLRAFFLLRKSTLPRCDFFTFLRQITGLTELTRPPPSLSLSHSLTWILLFRTHPFFFFFDSSWSRLRYLSIYLSLPTYLD